MKPFVQLKFETLASPKTGFSGRTAGVVAQTQFGMGRALFVGLSCLGHNLFEVGMPEAARGFCFVAGILLLTGNSIGGMS
jgi:hypothetical protein